MEEQNNNHNGNGNGFMLGVIVGVAVTLLFTTKKGREIFKVMTEKGLDKFTEMQDKVYKAQEEMEDEESDYIEPERRPSVPEKQKEVKYIAKEEVSTSASNAAEAVEATPARKTEVKEQKEEVHVEKVIEEKPEAKNGVAKKSSVRKFFRLKKS